VNLVYIQLDNIMLLIQCWYVFLTWEII
jgi:hypothetical protein